MNLRNGAAVLLLTHDCEAAFVAPRLQKDSHGLLECISGGSEEGEQWLTTALRETREEAGVQHPALFPLGMVDRHRGGKLIHLHLYVCRLLEGQMPRQEVGDPPPRGPWERVLLSLLRTEPRAALAAPLDIILSVLDDLTPEDLRKLL
jgi:8-oxo-dGTP pyrophosphatase MutT (NUDIX family)